jgi:hypothetical protein
MNSERKKKVVSLISQRIQRNIDQEKTNISLNLFNSGYIIKSKTIKKTVVKFLSRLLQNVV